LQLEGGAGFLLDGEQELGSRGEPLVEARADGPLDRRRRFERRALRGDLLTAGPEQEEALRDVEGDLLVLPVEAPVGAEELLARLLDRRVAAAEVEDQIAELSPRDKALALHGERAAGGAVDLLRLPTERADDQGWEVGRGGLSATGGGGARLLPGAAGRGVPALGKVDEIGQGIDLVRLDLHPGPGSGGDRARLGLALGRPPRGRRRGRCGSI